MASVKAHPESTRGSSHEFMAVLEREGSSKSPPYHIATVYICTSDTCIMYCTALHPEYGRLSQMDIEMDNIA